MPLHETTVPQIDQVVKSYDLEQQFWEVRKKNEIKQSQKQPKVAPKASQEQERTTAKAVRATI